MFMQWYRLQDILKWLGLGAGEEGELKKLEQTTIDKRIFIKIEVCVREGKLWPRVRREEAVRTLRCGGRR